VLNLLVLEAVIDLRAIVATIGIHLINISALDQIGNGIGQ